MVTVDDIDLDAELNSGELLLPATTGSYSTYVKKFATSARTRSGGAGGSRSAEETPTRAAFAATRNTAPAGEAMSCIVCRDDIY